VQLAGTVWFNINTANALRVGLTTRQQNLRIWTPDMIGSVCFLVASWLAVEEVCHARWCVRRGDVSWSVAAVNLLGSVFFALAALAAFVRPATGDLLSASIANGGTFLGALCFFWGARLASSGAPACCWSKWPALIRSVPPWTVRSAPTQPLAAGEARKAGAGRCF
jgi:hypothetical protein